MPSQKIAVIGAGSWGTCLADLLARNGHQVNLWAYEKELVDEIAHRHQNTLYLPGVKLSPSIKPTHSLQEALRGRKVLVLVVPSHVARGVMKQALPHLLPDLSIVCATKGIENETLLLMAEMLQDVTPRKLHDRIAVLSGPSFAKEVCEKQPTAVVMAAAEQNVTRSLGKLFTNSYFKVFYSTDLVGVQVGGALKNVIALASGGVEGLGLGYNTRAALIARGLAEITRLGVAMGADPRTFLGLSGLGDLVLTCTGEMSRNKTVGYQLGKGMKLKEILGRTRMVAEGVHTTRSAYDLARKMEVKMPIVEQIYAVLFQDKNPRRALSTLLESPGGFE